MAAAVTAAADSEEEYYPSRRIRRERERERERKERKKKNCIINYSMLSRANGLNKYPRVI